MTTIIFVEGNIGAGKSTLIQEIKRRRPHYVTITEDVKAWTLLDDVYRDRDTFASPFQMQVLVSHYLAAKNASPGRVYIMERSPYSARKVFVEMALIDDAMSDADRMSYDRFYHYVCRTYEQKFTNVEFLYLDTPTSICMRRIRQRGRPCEERVTDSYLERIANLYSTRMEGDTRWRRVHDIDDSIRFIDKRADLARRRDDDARHH